MGGSRGGGSPVVRVVEKVIPKEDTTAEAGTAREGTRKRRKGRLTDPNVSSPSLTGGTNDKLGQ